jgi:sugar lactone lactonase YvrE
LAIDSTGTIYVVDTVQTKIRKITPAGVVVTIAGTGAQGSADGSGSVATFDAFPRGIAVDTVGNVYLSDMGNSKIRKLMPGN